MGGNPSRLPIITTGNDSSRFSKILRSAPNDALDPANRNYALLCPHRLVPRALLTCLLISKFFPVKAVFQRQSSLFRGRGYQDVLDIPPLNG